MKHFLVGLIAVAALTISLQAGAQTAPPAPTPPGAAPAQQLNRMSVGGRATSERGATGSAARAHQRHYATHPANNASAGTKPIN